MIKLKCKNLSDSLSAWNKTHDIDIIINFHTHTNYLAQINYLYELVLWIIDNV
jgi:hypothetical protein